MISITAFETIIRFSIKHVGPKTTYEILTTLILLYARLYQIKVFFSSPGLLVWLMMPIIAASIVISLASSSVYLRFGCPLAALVILKLAIDAEIASTVCC
ncbi:unnamed protein product [Aureobasidium uvarum]|uniref:Uncharacterized protein n=1 Tax=Aureobasidium uvarum TaxID=2773716 RepID=A0A9N8PQL6_9PEZI|nr:unnamed protein product [Aureobasidium uvarum]